MTTICPAAATFTRSEKCARLTVRLTIVVLALAPDLELPGPVKVELPGEGVPSGADWGGLQPSPWQAVVGVGTGNPPPTRAS